MFREIFGNNVNLECHHDFCYVFETKIKTFNNLSVVTRHIRGKIKCDNNKCKISYPTKYKPEYYYKFVYDPSNKHKPTDSFYRDSNTVEYNQLCDIIKN